MSDKGMDRRRPGRPQAVPANEYRESMNRRQFLKVSALAAAGAVLAGAIGIPSVNSRKRGLQNPSSEKPKPQSLPPSSEKDAQKKTLNEILSLSHKDPERGALERKYVESARSLEEIDQGFWVVVDINERNLLLHKRSQLRLNQQEVLTPLTPEKIKWARENEIHPEALAICEDVYPKALSIMTRLQEIGVFGSGKKPEERLISPGGMTAITKEETACFILIGEYYSIEKLKGYPDEIKALQILAKHLSATTGLNYDAGKIPGSISGDIGFQMRPSTALEVLRDLQIIGEGFNIFDLKSSTIGANIYLARRGYYFQNPQLISQALTGWNERLGREGKIAKLDSSYRNTVGS